MGGFLCTCYFNNYQSIRKKYNRVLQTTLSTVPEIKRQKFYKNKSWRKNSVVGLIQNKDITSEFCSKLNVTVLGGDFAVECLVEIVLSELTPEGVTKNSKINLPHNFEKNIYQVKLFSLVSSMFSEEKERNYQRFDKKHTHKFLSGKCIANGNTWGLRGNSPRKEVFVVEKNSSPVQIQILIVRRSFKYSTCAQPTLFWLVVWRIKLKLLHKKMVWNWGVKFRCES